MRSVKNIVAAVFVTAALVTGAAGTASADVEKSRVCGVVKDKKVCGSLWLYSPDHAQQKEAWSNKTRKQLPKKVRLDTRYIGWSNKNVADKKKLWAVKSKINSKRWHLFELV